MIHAYPGHVPIFLPDDYTTHLRRLKQEHSAELSALLKPLEQLSLSERDAVGAAGIARAAALAWEANEDVIAALLPREVPRTLALPAPGIADWMLPEPPDGVGMYDSATQLLAHLARDWSADGAAARAKTHRPVLHALRRVARRGRGWRGTAALRVLVPGAGMGRLAWEVARRGHRVEASDASTSMLVAAHALLSGGVARGALRFFPRVRCEAGALRRAPCLAAARAPDVAPAALLHTGHAGGGGGNLTLQVGAFEQLYGNLTRLAGGARHGAGAGAAPPWDALLTSYFIDTLADPAAAVRTAWELLAPRGVWINVGPLHWHQPKLGFLRLSWAELRGLLRLRGFTLREHRVIRRVPYLGRPVRRARDELLSGVDSWHDAILFVAQKHG